MIQVTFQIEEGPWEALKREAHEGGRTQSQQIRHVLKQWLAELEKKRTRKNKKAA